MGRKAKGSSEESAKPGEEFGMSPVESGRHWLVSRLRARCGEERGGAGREAGRLGRSKGGDFINWGKGEQ